MGNAGAFVGSPSRDASQFQGALVCKGCGLDFLRIAQRLSSSSEESWRLVDDCTAYKDINFLVRKEDMRAGGYVGGKYTVVVFSKIPSSPQTQNE